MKSDYVLNIRSKIGHMGMFMPTSGLIVCKDNKILLQKRNDNGRWAMHGGGMEPGETIIETLYREIKEELNIKPVNPEILGIYSGEKRFVTYPNGDKVYIINHVFICEQFEGEINFNDGEVTEFKWFDIDNLPSEIFDVDEEAILDVKEYIKNKKTIVK